LCPFRAPVPCHPASDRNLQQTPQEACRWHGPLTAAAPPSGGRPWRARNCRRRSAAAGGNGGRKVRLLVEDDQSKPEEASNAVTKLVTQDKVVAVLGEVASRRSLAAAPVCQKYRIPMISPSSTNERVTEVGDYIFRVCFIDPFQGEVLAKFALTKERPGGRGAQGHSAGLLGRLTTRPKTFSAVAAGADRSLQSGDADAAPSSQVRAQKPP
jgi:hypothetical protein